MVDYEAMRQAVQAAQEKRHQKEFPSLAEGYTFKADGRSGFMYYREGNQILEIYWEMSGVPEYDVLISPSEIQTWTRPAGLVISSQKKFQIVDGLRKFLQASKIRADL
jgi:hypothetical protein